LRLRGSYRQERDLTSPRDGAETTKLIKRVGSNYSTKRQVDSNWGSGPILPPDGSGFHIRQKKAKRRPG